MCIDRGGEGRPTDSAGRQGEVPATRLAIRPVTGTLHLRKEREELCAWIGRQTGGLQEWQAGQVRNPCCWARYLTPHLGEHREDLFVGI